MLEELQYRRAYQGYRESGLDILIIAEAKFISRFLPLRQSGRSLPDRIPVEITEPVRYRVGFFLPFELFHTVMGTETPAPGVVWRGNVYKCADETSHPHWGCWQPVPELNFHNPAAFGELTSLHLRKEFSHNCRDRAEEFSLEHYYPQFREFILRTFASSDCKGINL